ncbi:hypothetical protein N303_14237, partial [Cuculus canorus]
AAIEFLLLSQGHGCEDFDGLCCMNLSDHSKSIFKQLEELKALTVKLKHSNIGFADWFAS